MSISRTNLLLNPHGTTPTGWSYLIGAGESSTVTASSGTDTPDGHAGYLRSTITTPKTGGVSGHYIRQTVPSGVPGDMYYASIYVRSSTAIAVYLSLECRTSGGLVSYFNGPIITIPANTWTLLSGTTAPNAIYDIIQVWAVLPPESIVPAGGTIDVTQALVTKTPVPGPYFDGDTAGTANRSYVWTGTTGASTSEEIIVLPTTTSVPLTDAPCPRVGVTVDGLLSGNTVYNLWRTVGGKRSAVRGARNRTTVDSDYVIDYEAPLGRPVTYDIEVVSGTNTSAPTYPSTVTVNSATWWIQDPLVPGSAQPLAVNNQGGGGLSLTAAAVKNLEYSAGVTIIPILGSSEPVALAGPRQIASNMDFSMFTNTAQATTNLRNLLQQAPLVLIRNNGVRNDGVPALAYLAATAPAEQPVTVAFGGTLTAWKLQGNLVAAPTLNVLVPIWTYGTVQALWDTYQQAQTTLAGKTYLDVLKSPSGV